MGGAAEAAKYSAVVHQAQSQLATGGHDPGVLDGFMGRNTAAAIAAYQTEKGLDASGQLDEATLKSLDIGVSTDLSKTVEDWIPVPSQAEIDKLKDPRNDPSNAYADYRPKAPAANLPLPGQAILKAMNASADKFGSRPKGHPRYSKRTLKAFIGCMVTKHNPNHWSDITIHYYCQMGLPRKCFTNALAGKPTPRRVKFARPRAYKGCANGRLRDAAPFKWVTATQPLIFQYVMFGQTHAFNHEQEQAIINNFYGVSDPANRDECKKKRPIRTEDPRDGTHCLVNKQMRRKLVGRSR
ncbi:MAG: peptidoglycan-binding protein [Alphaproteobacteria bacterium]|nr:peptidoglycan-binding protein [Alphaproteobacteria bacterium]